MTEDWMMHRGDLRGETRQLENAAILATLVDPTQSAVRIEHGVEVRSDTSRIVYLINPNCLVNGEWTRTRLLRTGLEEDTLATPELPHHPALDCRAGIRNARAITDWQRTGQHYHLVHSEDGTRTEYQLGSAGLLSDTVTIGTHSLAKVAALGLLGMGLYNIKGTLEEPQYIVQRYSVGMCDEDGEPITYDAAELIMQEIRDEMPLDHPWALAYRAQVTYEHLAAEVSKSVQFLIVTPDIVREGEGIYEPGGAHCILDPNATGKVWDDTEKAFFG